MPKKTLSELTSDLEREVVTLQTQFDALLKQIDKADLLTIRERLAVIENQIADMKSREDETDRRRWQLHLGFAVCVLTFVANLTVNLLMFIARK